MAVRAGSRDGQGEPDPGHFGRFCRTVMLEVLTDACGVDAGLAAQVGEDILARGESYAALDDPARDVLMAPFAEEVAGYEPSASPLELKGAVAVIVRSSLLEQAHSRGPVDAGGIRGITTVAAAPLSHFLAARRRHPVPVTSNQFAGLADTYPRAWRRSPTCPSPKSRLPARAAARTRSSSAASTPGSTGRWWSRCATEPREAAAQSCSQPRSAASHGTWAS